MIVVEKKITVGIIVALISMVAGGISYGIFSYYKRSLSEQAHGIFEQRYADFEKIVQSEDDSCTQALIATLENDYKDYKSSAFAPFFLALRSELQLIMGDAQLALESMDSAIAAMSSSDKVLYYTYNTKHALMQIESTEPAIQTKGRQKLERLALDNKNPMRDMALFYMGYQAFMDNDSQGVQSAWGKLFDAQKNPLSIWGVRAQGLLNYTA